MKRENKFPPGAQVTWMWGEQIIHGIVRKVFTHRVERTMKGATVTRDASGKNPAYLIQRDDGDGIFLNHSDLGAAWLSVCEHLRIEQFRRLPALA